MIKQVLVFLGLKAVEVLALIGVLALAIGAILGCAWLSNQSYIFPLLAGYFTLYSIMVLGMIVILVMIADMVKDWILSNWRKAGKIVEKMGK